MSEPLGPLPAGWTLPEGYVGVRNDRYLQLVRDADTLRQARELAAGIQGTRVYARPSRIAALLDLLAPVPDTGAEP